jgi:hypothetical protein
MDDKSTPSYEELVQRCIDSERKVADWQRHYESLQKKNNELQTKITDIELVTRWQAWKDWIKQLPDQRFLSEEQTAEQKIYKIIMRKDT